MSDSGKLLSDTLLKISNSLQIGELKKQLSLLKSYRDISELEKPKVLDNLIDNISKQLSTEYSNKLKSIKYHKKVEENDDLPF